MKDAAVPMTVKRVQSEKAAIKRIRKKINKKKIRSICLTAVAVAAVAAGLFYGIMLKEIYVPYDEAGIYIENDALYVKGAYRCLYIVDREDTTFIYMTTTVYDNLKHRGEGTPLSPYPPSFLNEDGSVDTVTEPEVNRIYYLPQEYAKLLLKGKGPLFCENGESYCLVKDQELEELKEKSVLVWEAEEEN
ncbi:MAG: hypothetical protein IKI49_04595 [Oscillospiraceae bacterium]|nr:hypothetical protein [Oscillospiraceae bacterium]